MFRKDPNVPEHKQFFHMTSASVYIPCGYEGKMTVDFPTPEVRGLPPHQLPRASFKEEEDIDIAMDADEEDTIIPGGEFEVPFAASSSCRDDDPIDTMTLHWIKHHMVVNGRKTFKYSDLFVDFPKCVEQDIWFVNAVKQIASHYGFQVIAATNVFGDLGTHHEGLVQTEVRVLHANTFIS